MKNLFLLGILIILTGCIEVKDSSNAVIDARIHLNNISASTTNPSVSKDVQAINNDLNIISKEDQKQEKIIIDGKKALKEERAHWLSYKMRVTLYSFMGLFIIGIALKFILPFMPVGAISTILGYIARAVWFVITLGVTEVIQLIKWILKKKIINKSPAGGVTETPKSIIN